MSNQSIINAVIQVIEYCMACRSLTRPKIAKPQEALRVRVKSLSGSIKHDNSSSNTEYQWVQIRVVLLCGDGLKGDALAFLNNEGNKLRPLLTRAQNIDYKSHLHVTCPQHGNCQVMIKDGVITVTDKDADDDDKCSIIFRFRLYVRTDYLTSQCQQLTSYLRNLQILHAQTLMKLDVDLHDYKDVVNFGWSPKYASRLLANHRVMIKTDFYLRDCLDASNRVIMKCSCPHSMMPLQQMQTDREVHYRLTLLASILPSPPGKLVDAKLCGKLKILLFGPDGVPLFLPHQEELVEKELRHLITLKQYALSATMVQDELKNGSPIKYDVEFLLSDINSESSQRSQNTQQSVCEDSSLSDNAPSHGPSPATHPDAGRPYTIQLFFLFDRWNPLQKCSLMELMDSQETLRQNINQVLLSCRLKIRKTIESVLRKVLVVYDPEKEKEDKYERSINVMTASISVIYKRSLNNGFRQQCLNTMQASNVHELKEKLKTRLWGIASQKNVKPPTQQLTTTQPWSANSQTGLVGRPVVAATFDGQGSLRAADMTSQISHNSSPFYHSTQDPRSRLYSTSKFMASIPSNEDGNFHISCLNSAPLEKSLTCSEILPQVSSNLNSLVKQKLNNLVVERSCKRNNDIKTVINDPELDLIISDLTDHEVHTLNFDRHEPDLEAVTLTKPSENECSDLCALLDILKKPERNTDFGEMVGAENDDGDSNDKSSCSIMPNSDSDLKNFLQTTKDSEMYAVNDFSTSETIHHYSPSKKHFFNSDSNGPKNMINTSEIRSLDFREINQEVEGSISNEQPESELLKLSNLLESMDDPEMRILNFDRNGQDLEPVTRVKPIEKDSSDLCSVLASFKEPEEHSIKFGNDSYFRNFFQSQPGMHVSNVDISTNGQQSVDTESNPRNECSIMLQRMQEADESTRLVSNRTEHDDHDSDMRKLITFMRKPVTEVVLMADNKTIDQGTDADGSTRRIPTQYNEEDPIPELRILLDTSIDTEHNTLDFAEIDQDLDNLIPVKDPESSHWSDLLETWKNPDVHTMDFSRKRIDSSALTRRNDSDLSSFFPELNDSTIRMETSARQESGALFTNFEQLLASCSSQVPVLEDVPPHRPIKRPLNDVMFHHCDVIVDEPNSPKRKRVGEDDFCLQLNVNERAEPSDGTWLSQLTQFLQ